MLGSSVGDDENAGCDRSDLRLLCEEELLEPDVESFLALALWLQDKFPPFSRGASVFTCSHDDRCGMPSPLSQPFPVFSPLPIELSICDRLTGTCAWRQGDSRAGACATCAAALVGVQ